MSSIASRWCRGSRAAWVQQQRARAERRRERRHRVRGDGQSALVVDRARASRPAAQGRDALGDEQRQHVPAPGGDLLADHQLEAVVAGGVELPCAQRAVDALVVGDGDEVEVGVALDVVEQVRATDAVPSE